MYFIYFVLCPIIPHFVDDNSYTIKKKMDSSTSNSTAFVPTGIFPITFANGHENYATWVASVIRVAGSFPLPDAPQGLLSYGVHLSTYDYGLALASAQILSLEDQQTAVWKRFTDEKVGPEGPAAPASTATDYALILPPPSRVKLTANLTAQQFAVAKAEKENYKQFLDAEANFKEQLIGSLDTPTRAKLEELYSNGLQSLTPNRVMDFAATTFQELSASLTGIIKKRFERKVASMDRIAATAIEWNAWSKTLGQRKLSDPDLCEKFEEACMHLPQAMEFIHKYNSENKQYDLRRFDAMVKLILDEMAANASTSIKQNLSPQLPKAVEPPPAQMQGMAEKPDKPVTNRGTNAGREGRGGRGVQGRGRSDWVYPNPPKTAAAKTAGPRKYCWCHGWTAHAGTTCTQMTDASLGWTDEHRNATAPVVIDGVMGHA